MGNDNRKITHYIKKSGNFEALKKKTNTKFSKVYDLEKCICYYTFCSYHC